MKLINDDVVAINQMKFYSSMNLNKHKFELIYAKATTIRDFKNQISDMFYNDLFKYRRMNWQSIDSQFPSSEIPKEMDTRDKKASLQDVFTAYQNNIATLNTYITFKRKNIPSTKMQKIMIYIAKYGYEGFSDDLREKYSQTNKKITNKILFLTDVIALCDKFGEDRLIKLALVKVKNKLSKIKFKKLSFRSVSRRTHNNIVDFNFNKQSKFNGIASLSGYIPGKALLFPTKINLSYHHKIDNKTEMSYQMTILDKDSRKVRIGSLIKTFRPKKTTKNNYIGVDLNTKHNLFATPHGEIDFDRELMHKYAKFLQKCENRNSSKLNKRRTKDSEKWSKRIESHILSLINKLIKLSQDNGKDHIILEDILNFKGKSAQTEFGIKQNKLMSALGFIGMKHIIRRIANKHNINVSFIQAAYTSQTCQKCGHISKENRKNQEEFKCELCGFTSNADLNSSINIQQRITSDVLRDSLLLIEESEYNPKHHIYMGHIRDSIHNHHQQLLKWTVES